MSIKPCLHDLAPMGRQDFVRQSHLPRSYFRKYFSNQRVMQFSNSHTLVFYNERFSLFTETLTMKLVLAPQSHHRYLRNIDFC